MRRTLSLVALLLMLVSSSWAGKKTPVRPDIKAPATTTCSGKQYVLPVIAPKTVVEPMTSRDVARLAKPKGMPDVDEVLLANQIAVINNGKKVGDSYPEGVKLQVPVYRPKNTSLSRADMREWSYAVHAGYRWGISPAFLLAVRNHENPSRDRDGFALGVMHAKWTSLWKQYDEGGWVIKRLIADRQRWNPMCITSNLAYRCGRSYANRSTTWGPAVWSLYRRACGIT